MDGQRNIAAEEGGQQQMHADEKPHRPMLMRVRDKMKKMRNTITGHGHGNGDEHEPEHEHDTGGGSSIDMDEDEVEDVEDKSVMDSGPELHGAPIYDSETIPSAAAKDVERNGATGMRLGDLGGQAAGEGLERKDATGMRLGDLGGQAAAKGVERNDATGMRLGDLGGQAAAKGEERNDDPAVRLGDLGGQAAAKGVERNDDSGVRLGDPVVEDPAAPNSKTPTPRGGEDIGTTDVERDFQAMTVSDDPKQAGAEKMDRDQVKETEAVPVSDGTGEEWTDAPTDAAYTGSYTDTAAGTTEDGKNLASTDYEKVAGVGTVVASKAQQVTPGFGAGGNAQDDSGTTEPMAVNPDMDEDEVEDVEDKSVMDSGPELHGAPMYDSETIPSAAKDVELNDATGMRLGDLGGQAAAKDVERNDDPAVRLGDLGGQAVAKGVERNDDPAVRLGDLGGQAVGKGVERNDDPAVRFGDLGGPVVGDPAAPHSKTPTPRGGEDIGTTDAVRDFQAMTVSDDPKQAGAEKMDRDQVKETEAMPVSDGTGEEWTDAPTDAAYTGSYTDTAAGTTEDGKNLARAAEDPAAPNSKTPTPRGGEDIGTTDVERDFQAMTVSDDPKQAGAEKMDRDQVKETEAMPVSDGTGEEWTDAPTDAAYTGSYTDTAAGTTEDGKNLPSTDYEKVAGVGTVVASKAQQVTPGFGAGGNAQDDSGTTEPMAVDAGKRDLDLPKEGTPASYPGTEELKNAATDATTEGAHVATYTDMFKSAAAGTTGYGMQLASSVYTAVASRVMPSTGTPSPGVGAQDGSTAATVTPGGNRVSETVQPTTEGNIGGGVPAEGPTLRGEEIEAPKTNTNVM